MQYIIKPNVGARFLAGFIDYTIIIVVNSLLIYTLGKPNLEGTYELNGWPVLILFVFWGFATIGIEQLFGATLGNGIVGLKPVKENFEKITFTQSLKRHLLDPVDMFFFGLVGIVIIKNTPNNQRVGDIWAKTIVVDANQIFTEE